METFPWGQQLSRFCSRYSVLCAWILPACSARTARTRTAAKVSLHLIQVISGSWDLVDSFSPGAELRWKQEDTLFASPFFCLSFSKMFLHETLKKKFPNVCVCMRCLCACRAMHWIMDDLPAEGSLLIHAPLLITPQDANCLPPASPRPHRL